METKKNIILPLFSGFYGSIHSGEIEYAEDMYIEDRIEQGQNWYDYYKMTDEFNIEYNKIYNEYAKYYTMEFIDQYAGEIEEETGIKINKYIKLNSLNNFQADEIIVEVEVINLLKTSNFILHSNFWDYIEVENKARDGFIPYMSDEILSYNDELMEDCNENKLTQIIEFYLISKYNWMDIDSELAEKVDSFQLLLENMYKIK